MGLSKAQQAALDDMMWGVLNSKAKSFEEWNVRPDPEMDPYRRRYYDDLRMGITVSDASIATLRKLEELGYLSILYAPKGHPKRVQLHL